MALDQLLAGHLYKLAKAPDDHYIKILKAIGLFQTTVYVIIDWYGFLLFNHVKNCFEN